MPLYEHNVSYGVIGKLTRTELPELMERDPDAGFRIYNNFFCRVGYDAVTFEQRITSAMPPGGALCGGMGPIQDRATQNAFPWQAIPARWYEMAAPRFEALGRHMLKGMKALGGVGDGTLKLRKI